MAGSCRIIKKMQNRRVRNQPENPLADIIVPSGNGQGWKVVGIPDIYRDKVGEDRQDQRLDDPGNE